MSLEKELERALDNQSVAYQQVVQVDPVESDYLITGVKIKPNVVKNQTLANSHSVPQGKSIIRRLEDVADFQFKKFMKADSPEISQYVDNYVLGICDAIGIMKNTAGHVEYEAVVNRYQNEITVGEKRPNG